MQVKFKLSGRVGLNYGIDGDIEIEKGQTIDVSEKIAKIWIKDGIAEAVEVEKPKSEVKESAKVEEKTKVEAENKSGKSKKSK